MTNEIYWLDADGLWHVNGQAPVAPPVAAGIPVAAFTTSVDDRTLTVDGSESSTSAGHIVRWVWDFGDGITDNGPSIQHTYVAYGNYSVALTVLNTDGVSNTTTLTVPIGQPANRLPTAAFTTSASGLTVTVDGTASHDADGNIVAYSWNFGDGQAQATTVHLTGAGGLATTTSYQYTGSLKASIDSAVVTGSSLVVGGSAQNFNGALSYSWHWGDGLANGATSAATHVYRSTGTYTVTLTVSDSTQTASATRSVTVSTVTPVSTGPGDPGGSGTTPSGSGVVNYTTLAGADFTRRTNAAGATTKVAYPPGVHTFSDFAYSGTFGAAPVVAGMLGAGSNYTTIQMVPNSSSKSAPTSGTNNLEYVKIETPPNGYKIDGILFNGTPQGHLYNGPQMHNPTGTTTISNCTFKGFPGNSGSPPGETFGFSLWHQDQASSVVNVTNCTFDGNQVSSTGAVTKVGAAISGTNTTSGTVTFTDCLFQNSQYSAGLAIWQLKSGATINLVRSVMKNCHRNLGTECQGGTINIIDPLWTDPVSGEDDIRISWTQGYNSGTINVRFTSQATCDAFFANRTNKRLLSQTATTTAYGSDPAYSGSNVIRNFCHFYIAGVEQNLSTYWNV